MLRKRLMNHTKSSKPEKRYSVQDDLLAKFLEHVAISPDKIAVMTTNCSLTYQELYIEVLHWKATLRRHIQDRTLVCLERTPRLLAVLLALQWLKITYIPVDPTTPLERIRTILDDSNTSSLLYDASDHPDYDSVVETGLNLSMMTERASLLESSEPYQPKHYVSYIIYTSGSTGKPKGVAISSEALQNFLSSMSLYFLQEDQALALAITTIAFDIAALELYLPIWNKKTLFLANQYQYKDPFQLVALLKKHPITLLQTTPSLWTMLLSIGWEGKKSLVALSGGEALNPSLAQQLLPKVSALWNMYGPTEATIWCSLKHIKPNEPITIGRPIAHMDMYVLDEDHRVLPPYVKGSLFISGVGLAEGYVNNEALTHEKFIRDKRVATGRIYQVGDLACSTEKGEFIVFGRTDNQIKLHGNRIELEEIEAHVLAYPGVLECAVSVYQEQLIAYLCLSDATTFSQDPLSRFLRLHLPEYMLPQRFIILHQMPLSLSGKLDRKALPVPEIATLTHLSSQQPLTETQAVLMRIWTEELRVPYIAIDDNFFELGGHSLVATRIIAKTFQLIGKKLSLHDFYTVATIEQCAILLEKMQRNSEDNDGNEPIKSWSSSYLPLNDFQLMLWMSRIFEPSLRRFNVVGRKRVQGPINKKAMDLALDLLLQKHEILSYAISRFYPIQKPHPKKPIVWEETSLIDWDKTTYEAHLSSACEYLFYQQTWRKDKPFIVAKLFWLPDDQIEIHICMPHLIADDSAVALLFKELSNAYLYVAQKEALSFQVLSQSYKQYVLQQNDSMLQHAAEDAAFWKHYLKDSRLFYFPDEEVLRKKKNQRLSVSTQIEIPESVLLKFHLFCVNHQLTLSDTMSAAIGLSLLRCCHSKAVPYSLFMNVVKSTRDNPQYDNILGCFLRLNTIKLDLKHCRTLLSLSKQVQQSTLETLPYQRAASLVKLAAVGHLPSTKKPFKVFFMSMVCFILSQVSPRFKLDATTLKACKKLSSVQRKNEFLINMNILKNFFEDGTQLNEPVFGRKTHPIPIYPYAIHQIDQVFDVCFHRNNDHNIAFVAITSNLRAQVQERFAQTLLTIMDQAIE